MPEVTRALALRGAELIFMPAGTDKRRLVGDLAQPDLVARDREPGHRRHHAEPVQPCRARPRHGRDAGRNTVREHRGGLFRGRCQSLIARAKCGRPPIPLHPRSATAQSRACWDRNGSGRSCARPCIRARATKPRSKHCAGERPCEFARHMSPRPDLGPKPRLGYSDSRIERAAELRADAAAIGALAREPGAGAYVIGGEWIVMKKGCAAQRAAVHAGRGASALSPRRKRSSSALLDGAPRFGHGVAPAGGGSAEDAATTCTSPICARSRCRAWSSPITCRRSPKPRRCCTGMRATASARTAARRPQIVNGGWRRDCPQCKAEHFPRTDPVVIMLASDGERCLLGRVAAFRRRPCGHASPASSSRANRSRMRCVGKRARKPASPAAASFISLRSHGRFRPR